MQSMNVPPQRQQQRQRPRPTLLCSLLLLCRLFLAFLCSQGLLSGRERMGSATVRNNWQMEQAAWQREGEESCAAASTGAAAAAAARGVQGAAAPACAGRAQSPPRWPGTLAWGRGARARSAAAAARPEGPPTCVGSALLARKASSQAESARPLASAGPGPGLSSPASPTTVPGPSLLLTPGAPSSADANSVDCGSCWGCSCCGCCGSVRTSAAVGAPAPVPAEKYSVGWPAGGAPSAAAALKASGSSAGGEGSGAGAAGTPPASPGPASGSGSSSITTCGSSPTKSIACKQAGRQAGRQQSVRRLKEGTTPPRRWLSRGRRPPPLCLPSALAPSLPAAPRRSPGFLRLASPLLLCLPSCGRAGRAGRGRWPVRGVLEARQSSPNTRSPFQGSQSQQVSAESHTPLAWPCSLSLSEGTSVNQPGVPNMAGSGVVCTRSASTAELCTGLCKGRLDQCHR